MAYQAMDRRDIMNGINDFLTDTIVLPPGDFDKELLMPIIETAKMKNNNAKRRSTRRRKQAKSRSGEGPQQQNQAQGQSCRPLTYAPLTKPPPFQHLEPF